MAALVLTANIGRTANFIQVDEALELGTANATVQSVLAPTFAYDPGNSANSNALDQWWMPATSPVTLGPGNSVTYTLTNLTDTQGRAISFAGGVRGIGFQVTNRIAGQHLVVGGAASNPWVGFGGNSYNVYDFDAKLVQQTDGFAVANGSNEQIKILNSSNTNSITFNLLIFGCLT